MAEHTVLIRQLGSCNKLTGEKPHKCTVCSKVFRKKDHLKRHEFVHSVERRFGCKSCGKTYKSEASLTRHENVHSEERRYSCNHCKNTYKWKANLTEHMHQHSKELCFVCEVCGKAFATKKDLTHHKEVHSKNRPYKCDQCRVSFKRFSSMLIHKKTHNIEIMASSYSCEHCGVVYRYKRSLTVHQISHAAELPNGQGRAGSEVALKAATPNSYVAASNMHSCMSCGLNHTTETCQSSRLTIQAKNTSLAEEEGKCQDSDLSCASTILHQNLLNAPTLTMLAIPRPYQTYEEENSDVRTGLGIFQSTVSDIFVTQTKNTSLVEEGVRREDACLAGRPISTSTHRNQSKALPPSILGIPQPSQTFDDDNAYFTTVHGSVPKSDASNEILGRHIIVGKPLTKLNNTYKSEDTNGEMPMCSLLEETKPVQLDCCSSVAMTNTNEEDSEYKLSSEVRRYSPTNNVEPEAIAPGRNSPQIPADLLEEADELVAGWCRAIAVESAW